MGRTPGAKNKRVTNHIVPGITIPEESATIKKSQQEVDTYQCGVCQEPNIPYHCNFCPACGKALQWP